MGVQGYNYKAAEDRFSLVAEVAPQGGTWTGWTHEIRKIESDDHSPCSSEPYVQSSYKLGFFAESQPNYHALN